MLSAFIFYFRLIRRVVSISALLVLGKHTLTNRNFDRFRWISRVPLTPSSEAAETLDSSISQIPQTGPKAKKRIRHEKKIQKELETAS